MGDATGARRRRASSALCLAVPALALLPGPSAVRDHAPFLPALHLVWVDVFGAAPFAFQGMAREVESILAGLGVEAVWRRSEGGTLILAHEVTVILMASDPSGSGLRGDAMGAVRRSDSPQRAVWVYLPKVAWALGLDTRGPASWSQSQRGQLALALARVVAHEVIHALTPELPHTKRGLMASRMGRTELLKRRVEIDPAFRAAFLSRVAEVGAPPGDTRTWTSTIR